MMKKIAFSFLVAALLPGMEANSHCGKNAWIHWTVDSYDNNLLCGTLDITSGKGAWDIAQSTMYAAFSDCAYEKSYCKNTGGNTYCCNEIPNTDTSWVGSGNIEFSCSDGPYTCYDFKWQRK